MSKEQLEKLQSLSAYLGRMAGSIRKGTMTPNDTASDIEWEVRELNELLKEIAASNTTK